MFTQGWKTKLKELGGIDIRSLALFRIGLALVLLGDLLVRVQDLKAHYSDWGVLPRDVLIYKIVNNWNVSFHLINGTWQIQLFLFILAALFALALLIGYHTRLATIFSWLLLISIHTRNPMVLQGGDIVLRLLLFWAIFLPLGAYASIDQKRQKKPLSNQIVSVATFALLLQICFVYWFTALLKTHDIWRQDGTAVWYALSIEQYSTSLGVFLLKFPNLLKILTFATLYLELFGPFFAFSPIWTGPLRGLIALIFILFHVSLNFTMELGPFSYICIVAWIVFIPSCFWDRFLKRQHSTTVPWKANYFSNGSAAFFLIYVFLWNVQGLEKPFVSLPSPLNALGSLVRIDQYWNMFSPYPLQEDGWFVIPAKLRDGTEVDLFREGQSLNWEKPPLLSAIYKNDRWRSYMMNLLFEDEVHLLWYGRYLCKKWNSSHPFDKQLLTFDIYFMLKINAVEKPFLEPVKTHLWHHECFDPKDD